MSGIARVRDALHVRGEGLAREGVEGEPRLVADREAHDVAVRERRADDPSAREVADDEHGRARLHELARLAEPAQHDAVGRRDDLPVARVEARVVEVGARNV